jgi:hypothetical protein
MSPTPPMKIETVLSDPAASDWLKASLRSALARNPLDAASDVEIRAIWFSVSRQKPILLSTSQDRLFCALIFGRLSKSAQRQQKCPQGEHAGRETAQPPHLEFGKQVGRETEAQVTRRRSEGLDNHSSLGCPFSSLRFRRGEEGLCREATA